MSTYILELNRNQAVDSKLGQERNSEYTVLLKSPLVVDSGDQISMRLASIDSQQINPTNIVIEEDTVVTIQYSIYDVDYSTQDKKNINKGARPTTGDYAAPTFDYFAAYNDLGLVTLNSIDLEIVGYLPPVVDGRTGYDLYDRAGTFLIDQTTGFGNSDQWFLATVEYLDSSGDLQTAEFTGTNMRKTSQYDGEKTETVYVANSPKLTLTKYGVGTVTAKSGSIQLIGFSGIYPESNTVPEPYRATRDERMRSNPPNAKKGRTDINVRSSDFKLLGFNTTSAGGGGTYQLDLQRTSVTIPSGVYDQRGMAVLLTQKLNDGQGILSESTVAGRNIFAPKNRMLQRTDELINENLVFRRLDIEHDETVAFDASNSYIYNNGTDPIPVFVGASQFAIEFGSAGNVFSLNYAHMPLWDPLNDKKQYTGVFWSGTAPNETYHQINQSSGIVIHDLEPVEFWRDKIGLYEQLIVPLHQDENGVKFYLKNSMESKITYGFSSLDSFILAGDAGHDNGTKPNYNNPRRVIPDPPDETEGLTQGVLSEATGNSRSIIGEPVYANPTGGYFLVEVQGLPSNPGNYLDTDGTYPLINAIVSKQYTTNNVVTGYADSGIPYTHTGQSAFISALKVRILDTDKNLVDNLGRNNTIFIQVNKAK